MQLFGSLGNRANRTGILSTMGETTSNWWCNWRLLLRQSFSMQQDLIPWVVAMYGLSRQMKHASGHLTMLQCIPRSLWEIQTFRWSVGGAAGFALRRKQAITQNCLCTCPRVRLARIFRSTSGLTGSRLTSPLPRRARRQNLPSATLASQSGFSIRLPNLACGHLAYGFSFFCPAAL